MPFPYDRIKLFEQFLFDLFDENVIFNQMEFTITEDVYEKIQSEVDSFDGNVDTSTIKSILEKLSLTKYYKYSNHFLYKFTDKIKPVLDENTYNNIINMFRKVSNVHNEMYKNKISMLGPRYILYKLFQILNLGDDFLNIVSLSKSTEKNKENNKRWKEICILNDWNFIPNL